MPPDLTSVNLKLQRAQEHFQTLKDEMRAYFHHKPYTYTVKVSEGFTRYSIILKKSKCIAPVQRWALITGDCVHNLRSALDHLMRSIAISKLKTLSAKDEGILAFPISDKPNSIASFRGRFDADVLHDSVWAAIQGVQPDVRRNPDLPDDLPAWLAILSTLDNHDKHRLVRLSVPSPIQTGIGFDFSKAEPMVEKYTEDIYYGELQDGTDLYSVVFDRPTRNVGFDKIDLLFAFTVWHGAKDPTDQRPWMHRSDLLGVLAELTKEVQEVIAIVVAAVPD